MTHAFWYGFRNNYWQNNDQSDVEANYGLIRVDFSIKPAYAAFKAAVGGDESVDHSRLHDHDSTTTVPSTSTTTTTPRRPLSYRTGSRRSSVGSGSLRSDRP